MTLKYSDLKKIIVDEKEMSKNPHKYALLTHCLQNFSLKSSIIHDLSDLVSLYEKETLIDLLKIVWDIPFPPDRKSKFTFIDLFAGIGGTRIAFQNSGCKCVFSSEWDKYSAITYEANFGEVPFGDITKIDASFIPQHDILVAGFPCQPFSISGVSKKNALNRKHGFLCETQGTLFFDIARIIEVKRPLVFLLENVKNLKSHDRGKTYLVIKKTLENLNYKIFDAVLDGKYYVPQHRERIFIVGFDQSIYGSDVTFNFPVPDSDISLAVRDILQKKVSDKYTLTNHLWSYLQEYAKKHRAKGNGFGYGLTSRDGITRTLSARYYKDGSEILIPQRGKNPRRLTPRECARLQGFDDEFKIVVSDTQAYKQFGNSVVVPLVTEIARKIVASLQELENRNSEAQIDAQ